MAASIKLIKLKNKLYEFLCGDIGTENMTNKHGLQWREYGSYLLQASSLIVINFKTTAFTQAVYTANGCDSFICKDPNVCQKSCFLELICTHNV